MVNDAGDTLRFTQRRQLKSLNVADTAYRALVYYNRKVTGAEFINLSLIPVVAPVVPQYYSVRSYLSIPLQTLSTGTIIHLRIRDYQGWITKNFSIER